MTSTSSPDPVRRGLRTAAVTLFWLALWQAAAVLAGQELLLVSPVQVVVRLVELLPAAEFWTRVGYSFGRILAGFGSAVVAGAALALLAALSPTAAALLSPVVRAMRTVPVFSFIILVLIWADPGWLATIVSFLMVMPIVYADILEGLRHVDAGLLELAQVFRVPRHRRWLAIDLPAVWPHLTTACIVGVGLAWKSGIAAEVIGLPTGSIGERLYQAKIFLSTPDLFAWTLAVIGLSFALEKAVLWLLGSGQRRLQEAFARP